MSGLPYYKAYPRDFFGGTVGLPFELKGAYRLVLDLIYMQGGHLPDDARYIAGQLGCSVRRWNGLRKSLIEAGKIAAIDGVISNFRADKELETLRKLQDQQRENRSRPNKIKHLRSPPSHHTESEPDTDTGTASAVPTARDELDRLEIRLREAAGEAINAAHPTLSDLSAPLAWLANGADLEADILPTLRGKRPRKPVLSWRWFEGAVMDARDRRMAGLPERTVPSNATAALMAEFEKLKEASGG